MERRSLHVRFDSIQKFAQELDGLHWVHHNLLFLDEVSFDNRGCWRTRGYAPRGKHVAVKTAFARLPRVSMLTFVNVNGVVDIATTEGTFTSDLFRRACVSLVKRGPLHHFPGRNSIWVLDGARIHYCEALVNWLRMNGIRVIFCHRTRPSSTP